jgi:ABC-type antimicrobial peptide transport system permease subunit
MVNESFAKAYSPNQDPVGRRFGIDAKYSNSFEIVGVFKDFKINNPREATRPVFLRPTSQYFAGYQEDGLKSGEFSSMFIDSILLKFNRPQEDVESLARRTLASIDPNLTIDDLRSLDAQVAGNFNGERLLARLTSLFGLLALVLASIGLYGVTAYFVARRTSEIGIRMALGSTRSGVVALVMRSVFSQIGIGLVLGIGCSLLAGHLMESQLYGVSQYDVTALAAATAVLALSALLAGFIPARRASSIEPMQALRTE